MSSQLDKNAAALAALAEYVKSMPTQQGVELTAESIAEALGYTPAPVAKQYELIETITCDGTYGVFGRTNMRLARAKIYLHTTAAATAVSLVAEISNSAGLFGYAWMGNGINTADRWAYLCAVSDGDEAYIEFTAPSAQQYSAAALSRTPSKYDGATPINKISIYATGGAMLPAGSTIEIWGVRA